MYQQARKFALLAAVAMMMPLSACDVSTPSKVSVSPIRLKEQDAVFTLDAAHMDAGRIAKLSDDYHQKGRGPMNLVMPYPEGASPDQISAARARGEAWQKAFARQGIADVGLTLVPLASGEAGAGSLIMRYKSLAALPPKNCERLPGHQGAEDLNGSDTYSFGCETNTAISKMIADPSDLDGKESASQDGESRRAGTVVEKYKAGTPNEPLKGFTASTVGQSQ